MKRPLLWGLVLCLIGCQCHRQTTPAVAETPVSPAVAIVSAQPATPITVPQEKVAVNQPQSVPSLPQTPDVMPPAAQITDELTPAEMILQARAAQTLTTPAPDAPVFKKEELISLEGRRLSPMAYEPLYPTAPQTAPWANEQLKYGLYYSFVKAGTAYIRNRGLTTVNGRDAYLIQTSAFSAPVIDTVFKVRDINLSWLDAQTFYSLGYTQSLREGNYKRDEWVAFDLPHKRYYGEIQKKGDPSLISGELSGPVLDMLTSLYYVRAHDLQPGKDIVLDVVNREAQYPLLVKVIKRETIKTAAGKFNCILVEPQFRGEGIFVSKGKSLQVWLTDDVYKMPVKMKAEVFIGSVYAELLEYKRN